MHSGTATSLFLALLNGWEVVALLAVILVLFGLERLLEFDRGLWRGIRDAFEDEAGDAGKSLSGIYGKAGGQAITPDNQVAKLYDFSRRRWRSWRAWETIKRKLLTALRHSEAFLRRWFSWPVAVVSQAL